MIDLIDGKAGDRKSPVAFLYSHPIFVAFCYIKTVINVLLEISVEYGVFHFDYLAFNIPFCI